MRDPFSWSFPIGRMFGIQVRIHLLFPIVALGLIFRAVHLADEGHAGAMWGHAFMVVGLLFFAVLLHEFGHCFVARAVGGEANEVLLWPLGGLANVDVPHSARANFLTAAGGPFVNLLICTGCGLALLFALPTSYWPPINPFWPALFSNAPSGVELLPVGVSAAQFVDSLPAVILARFFWVSWVLLLINTLLVGYPLDGGRMLQAALWPYVGYRQAMMVAIRVGFIVMILTGIASFVANEVMLLALAILIYTACKQQWFVLETGGEDSLFGYDFSQGYTSLERDQQTAPPKRKQPNFIQRWLQRRAAKKLQKEQQKQFEEERRLDQLLEKIHQFGKESLSEEEQRFLKRVADHRNRNRP